MGNNLVIWSFGSYNLRNTTPIVALAGVLFVVRPRCHGHVIWQEKKKNESLYTLMGIGQSVRLRVNWSSVYDVVCGRKTISIRENNSVSWLVGLDEMDVTGYWSLNIANQSFYVSNCKASLFLGDVIGNYNVRGYTLVFSVKTDCRLRQEYLIQFWQLPTLNINSYSSWGEDCVGLCAAVFSKLLVKTNRWLELLLKTGIALLKLAYIFHEMMHTYWKLERICCPLTF